MYAKRMNKISVIVLLILFILVALVGWVWSISDSGEVPVFVMSNNLVCEIERATDGESIGKTISLVDLATDSPRAIFPTGTTSPMKKVSETDQLLVIQLVASGSGSTDTITVFKETGKFEREAKGSFFGDYSASFSGQCK